MQVSDWTKSFDLFVDVTKYAIQYSIPAITVFYFIDIRLNFSMGYIYIKDDKMIVRHLSVSGTTLSRDFVWTSLQQRFSTRYSAKNGHHSHPRGPGFTDCGNSVLHVSHDRA